MVGVVTLKNLDKTDAGRSAQMGLFDEAFDWCVRAGWLAEDQRTEWTERAVAALSSVSTGPHNIYGGWLAPQSEMDALIYAGRYEGVEAFNGHPMEIHGGNRAVVMRCTNLLSTAFLSRISCDRNWTVEVNAASGVTRDEWVYDAPDDHELLNGAILTPDGWIYHARPFLMVSLWQVAS